MMREPRLSATDKLVLLAAEKLADDDGNITLDDETMAKLQHPAVVLADEDRP